MESTAYISPSREMSKKNFILQEAARARTSTEIKKKKKYKGKTKHQWKETRGK